MSVSNPGSQLTFIECYEAATDPSGGDGVWSNYDIGAIYPDAKYALLQMKATAANRSMGARNDGSAVVRIIACTSEQSVTILVELTAGICEIYSDACAGTEHHLIGVFQ